MQIRRHRPPYLDDHARRVVPNGAPATTERAGSAVVGAAAGKDAQDAYRLTSIVADE